MNRAVQPAIPQAAASTKQPAERGREPYYPGAFGALRIRDYRLFFLGALTGNIGVWMQAVAQGWLVVSLTSSELYVGLVGFFAMIPSLLLSLVGGILADRLDRRKLLMTTQVISAVLVAVLAALVHTGRVQLWHIMAISFGTGTMIALNSSSWQAIVPDIVGRKNLLNAIALNSAQFNLTRTVGPTVAGLLIGYVGIAGAYYFNACAYLAFTAALWFIHPRYTSRRTTVSDEGLLHSLKLAMQYVWSRSAIRMVMIMAAVQTVFLFPYSTLLPVFAKDVLGLDASGYGLLLAAAGVGAFTGAMMLAFRGESRNKFGLMLVSQFLLCAGVAVFGLSTWLPLSLLALALTGWSFVTFLATGNTLLQVSVPDELRGRVMSIWMLVGLGLMPIASLQAGAVAALTSPAVALASGAFITFVFTCVVALRQRHLYLDPETS